MFSFLSRRECLLCSLVITEQESAEHAYPQRIIPKINFGIITAWPDVWPAMLCFLGSVSESVQTI
jgi:hypothetical protein